MTTPLPRSTDSVPAVGSVAHAPPAAVAALRAHRRTTSFRMAPPKYRPAECDLDELPVRRVLATAEASVVLVEAATRLSAQQARVLHDDDACWRRHARLSK